MPTQPFTAVELDDSHLALEIMMTLEKSGDDHDEIMDALLLFAAEPLQRTLKQDIGPKRLSIARLQREAAARGCDEDDASVTTCIRFGFRLDWLPAVVEALDVPDEVETDGGHVFTGEDMVLLLLARFRSTNALRSMTWECGRSISAMSAAAWAAAAAAAATPLLPSSLSTPMPPVCKRPCWRPYCGLVRGSMMSRGGPGVVVSCP
jgi:hypothetical protein